MHPYPDMCRASVAVFLFVVAVRAGAAGAAGLSPSPSPTETVSAGEVSDGSVQWDSHSTTLDPVLRDGPEAPLERPLAEDTDGEVYSVSDTPWSPSTDRGPGDVSEVTTTVSLSELPDVRPPGPREREDPRHGHVANPRGVADNGMERVQDPDAVSLAFVFDSTGSMHRDLEQLKKGASAILEAMLARPDKPIHDYVFVPFNDPGVGPANVTTDPDIFRAQLDAVRVHGGFDCPEPSFTALLQALSLVRPNSFIYVFTDASAKDHHLQSDVLSLIQRKQSQVVFLMTGNCKDDKTPRYQAMEDVAAASSGQVYHINKTDVENVLGFVGHTLDSQKVNLVSVDLPSASSNKYAVEVDESIRELTVSVSGTNPHISVLDPAGVVIDKPPAVEHILDLDNVKVVAVREPYRGAWTVETSSDSKHAVRLTGLSVVDFSYGFSAQPTDDLEETYHRPLEGSPNYLLVGGSENGSIWNLTAVDLIAINGSTLQSIPLTPLGAPDGKYRGGPFTPSEDFFYLANSGHGRDGYPIKRITPTAISAQPAGLPIVHLQSERVAWISQPLTLLCQIDSLVPFTAWWFKNGEPVSKKMKYLQTAMMSLKIDSVIEDNGGEYTCRASNVEGHSTGVVNVVVTGPAPEVSTTPHLRVYPHQQVVLDCSVKSPLQSNTTWVRLRSPDVNDAELVENNARYVILRNASLIIDPVMPEDEGMLSCFSENRGGRGESRTRLEVAESLKVHVNPKQVQFQKGESFLLSCETAGTQPVQFYWEKDGRILQVKENGRVTVTQSGTKLVMHVRNAKLTDQAVYRCFAATDYETAEGYSEGYYVEMPSVRVEHSEEMARAGSEVLFHCFAQGIPQPTSRWLWEGSDVKQFPRFEATDNGSLLIHHVQPEDAGQFDCVGQNSLGEVKDSINLTVGYPPMVQEKPSVLNIEITGSGSLPCNGTGIPHPTVHWERIDGNPLDLNRIQLDPKTGSLIFSDARVEDSGRYMCVLKNKFGHVSLNGTVLITGVVPPSLEDTESKLQDLPVVLGDRIELPCKISLGHPPPTRTWYKDGNEIDLNEGLNGITLTDNGSLIITKTDGRHSGSYRCEVTNQGGSTFKIIQLKIMDPPVIEMPIIENVTEVVGYNALLPCQARGLPQPDIIWLHHDGRPVAFTERILKTYEGLLIIGVQLVNAGKYVCSAMSVAGSANRTISLDVLDPPHIVGKRITEIVAILGDVVQLPCEATGKPAPDILWFHDNANVLLDDHTVQSTNMDGLIITSVKVTDAGDYVCSAVNLVGSSNKTISLTVQDPPKIDTSSPSEIVAVFGSDTELVCSSAGIPAPRIAWTLHGQTISRSDSVQLSDDEQTITLSNVQESDSGSYVCTAYNLAGSDARTFKLTVHVLPTIEPFGSIINITEGDQVLLNCSAHGLPAPAVTWLKDGNPVLVSDLTAAQYRTEADISKAGVYECQARNSVGTQTRAINVSVLVPPKTLAPSNISINVTSGRDVELQCLDSSQPVYPDAFIHWSSVNGSINASDPQFSYNSAGNLIIHNITPSQAGTYICTAHNDAGASNRSVSISVRVAPRIKETFLPKKTLMEGEDYSMLCSSDGIPKPTIFWMYNNDTLDSANQFEEILLMKDDTLVIISATPNTSGLYTCFARNEEGEDNKQTAIEVYVPPKIMNGDIIHKEVMEGENIVLDCPVSEASDITWEQNGEPIDFTANERSDEGHFTLLDGGRSLRIIEALPTDNGTYVCIASNPVGQREAVFSLEVLWPPFFEEFGNNQKEFTLVEGSNVTFDCLSSGSPTPKVIWKKNETLPVTEHTTPGVVVLPTSRHLLSIPSVRAHHDGHYECQAINKVGRSNRQFLLNVIVPPNIEGEEEELHEVLQNDNFTLNCDITGSPKPSFIWDRSNSSSWADNWNSSKYSFENNSKLLVIHGAQYSDSGVYTCNGSNAASSKTKHFKVTVYEAPSMGDVDQDEEIHIRDGDTLSLVCTAHGQPLPDIRWYHNGQPLDSADTFEQYDLDSSEVTQTLQLESAGYTNAGKYVCHATNPRGAAERVYRVRYLVVPKMDSKFSFQDERIQVVKGLPLNIHCPAVGEPTPKISWMKDNLLLDGNQSIEVRGDFGKNLFIKETLESHSGNYLCIASNIAGNSSKAFFLDVLVPPFTPDGREEIRESVLRQESLHLTCNFIGHPEPKLMWIKGIEPVTVNHSSQGIYLTDGNQSLLIPDVELNHTGRYSCLASNEAGSAELMFHIQVLEPPRRNEAVTRNFTVIMLRPHRRFMLLCAMTGSPSPNITWFKDDFPLGDSSLDEGIQISSDGRQLHIFQAQKEHEGLYMCLAENSVGSESAYFGLHMNVPAEWGEWADWSSCSVSCGSGTQERVRVCQGVNCPGESKEEKSCFMSHCPVDGGWSEWTDWTDCSQPCGQAQRFRLRKCNNPEPAYGGIQCVGEDSETENCGLPPCPIHGGWSDWSAWSACSVSCDFGVQLRVRKCNNPEPAYGGSPCSGSESDMVSCNLEPCTGTWSEWSEWTHCSASCGSGSRLRRRKCLSPGLQCTGDNLQFEHCKLRRCPRGGPRVAAVHLRGNLNGRRLWNDTFYANILGSEDSKPRVVTARLHQVRKREAPLLHYMPLLMSPVSWNAAYEDGQASNGYSLTKGHFNQESKVQFASGEEMQIRHMGHGVDAAGQLQVDIEVIGEVPFIQPRATILIQPFSEEFIQTGPNSIHASSEGSLKANGNLIPYIWNKTISYNLGDGSMPYYAETMSTEDIRTSYDPDLQEMTYSTSTVISKSFNENKCPDGFKLDAQHQHCEDVDECLDSSFNNCHSTQLCENLLGSYRCSCPPGFRSITIGQRCLDINECLQEPSLCSHECRNIPGSYLCVCPPGTFLREDRHTCSALTYWDDPDEAYGTDDGHESDESEVVDREDYGVDDLETSESHNVPQEYRMAAEERSCDPGLEWRDGTCKDKDECFEDPYICGEDEICLNMHGTFECLHAPCGHGFKRDPETRECLAFCSEKEMICESGATIVEKKVFFAVSMDSQNAEPGMDLVHLTVSPEEHGHLYETLKTRFYITSNHKGKLFHVREELGNGVLFSSRPLKQHKMYRISIRANTYGERKEAAILYSTKFVIFIYVSQE